MKRLPGQPESNDYFEVLDARPIPDGFFGYVGEYSGERFEDGAKSIRAVALVKRNGDVWPVEGLVEEIPEGDPVVSLRALDDEADYIAVRALNPDGEYAHVAYLRRGGFDWLPAYSVVKRVESFGPYEQEAIPALEFAPLAFLVFYHLPKLAGRTPTWHHVGVKEFLQERLDALES